MSQEIARLIASVVIIENDRALVLHEPEDNGIMEYNLPGGHMELGENLIEAAKRETKEETGLDIEVTDLLGIRFNTWSKHDSVTFVFYGQRKGGQVVVEKGATAQWLTKEEVMAIPEDQWSGGKKEFLLLAFDGLRLDAKGLIMFDKKERLDWHV